MNTVRVEFRLKGKSVIWPVDGALLGVSVVEPISRIEMRSRSSKGNFKPRFSAGRCQRAAWRALASVSVDAEQVIIAVSHVQMFVVGVDICSDEFF